MIIFYNKTDGNIEGVIEGRMHGSDQLKAWIGDPKEIGRIVIQWDKTNIREEIIERDLEVGSVGEDGFYRSAMKRVKQKVTKFDLEPIGKQKKIYLELDKDQMKAYKYKVDVKTKELIRKK